MQEDNKASNIKKSCSFIAISMQNSSFQKMYNNASTKKVKAKEPFI